MFDWANSVYNLVITATIFPAYFETITKHSSTKTKFSEGASGDSGGGGQNNQ